MRFLLPHCIAHFPVCLRGALCPKMSAAPPLPRHSRTMTSYLGLLPRTINFVFPLQSRRRRHLRSRHACGIFSKSCHATLDARVITSPRPSPKERGREERAARKGGSLALQSLLLSVVREGVSPLQTLLSVVREEVFCVTNASQRCNSRSFWSG